MIHALTKNIWRHELQCKCGCGADTLDWETLTVLQETCDHFARWLKMPRVHLTITSATRCQQHNTNVGGSPTSQHLVGRAIDFRIRGVAPIDVYRHLDGMYPNKYGIGDYGTFTHIDTRTGPPRRW